MATYGSDLPRYLGSGEVEGRYEAEPPMLLEEFLLKRKQERENAAHKDNPPAADGKPEPA